MVKTAKPESKTPAQLGYRTQSLTILLEEVDTHFQHPESTGVTIVEDLRETIYGEFHYAALDLDSHHWLLSRHARDRSWDEWGGQLAKR
jgi:uncharacterized glyoxalase superfamily protein PhnB